MHVKLGEGEEVNLVGTKFQAEQKLQFGLCNNGDGKIQGVR